jgi:hypothetical protein
MNDSRDTQAPGEVTFPEIPDFGSPEPEVGIFWTNEGKLFHLESAPISKAVHTRVSVDYANGHYASWFVMGKRGILDSLPPHMRDEYDAIPRGRVVYLFARKTFVIYHGDDYNPTIQEEIVRRLHLPADLYTDEIDEHYNPLPDDFLF